MITVYRALVESELTFNIASWFNFVSAKNKEKLARVIKQASKIIGTPQIRLVDLYNCAVKRKVDSIVTDPSHPLFSSLQLMPSGGRFRAPLAKKKAYRNSFIPSAISILNKTKNCHLCLSLLFCV